MGHKILQENPWNFQQNPWPKIRIFGILSLRRIQTLSDFLGWPNLEVRWFSGIIILMEIPQNYHTFVYTCIVWFPPKKLHQMISSDLFVWWWKRDTHSFWVINFGHLEAGIQQTIWIIFTISLWKFNQSTTWMNISDARCSDRFLWTTKKTVTFWRQHKILSQVFLYLDHGLETEDFQKP